jgi:hypothetical protein
MANTLKGGEQEERRQKAFIEESNDQRYRACAGRPVLYRLAFARARAFQRLIHPDVRGRPSGWLDRPLL